MGDVISLEKYKRRKKEIQNRHYIAAQLRGLADRVEVSDQIKGFVVDWRGDRCHVGVDSGNIPS